MKNIIETMFEAFPGKKTIVLNEKCSDCRRSTVIEITRTSAGFGLQGGALFKSSSGAYFAKCLECYTSNPIHDPNRVTKSGGLK